MKFKISDLSSGIKLVEIPSSDAESVVVDFFVKTGSRCESEKESGISHFLEHFLFKGTKKFPSAMAISYLVDEIGGEMNAATGKEHTHYYIKAASKHLARIFEVLEDMMKNPLLDKDELEKEKGVIVEEINMYKDTPMYEIENVLERTMWPREPLGRDIAGSKETVTAFTPEMFREYMARTYKNHNIILGVSGKYDSLKLKKMIQKNWGKTQKKFLKVSAEKLWSSTSDLQEKPRFKLEYKETEQAHLALGFKSIAYSDKRLAVQSVLSAILSGGMSGRLFTEVREKRGLCYYIRASGSPYQDTGVFSIQSGLKIDKIQEAYDVIVSELEKMKKDFIPKAELQKAKEYLKGKTILALEDNQVRLDWLLERVAFYPKVLTPKESFARVDKVTAKDVKDLANEIFQKKNLSVAIIGPYKDESFFTI